MNAQNRSDAYLLPDGGQKMTYEKDTKIPNAGTFTLYREDHTIANMLRMQLLSDDRVSFAGYMHPHPLLHDVLVRIQTNEKSNPLDSLSSAIEDLSTECEELTQRFKTQLDAFKQKQEESIYS